MTGRTTIPTPIDPHGYHPIVVDETNLTPDERREHLHDLFRSHAAGDQVSQWMISLTPEELKKYSDPPKQPRGPLTDVDLDRAGRAQATRQRANARRLNSEGHRVWYGDGVPPWLRLET
jgi:hypothetical protein